MDDARQDKVGSPPVHTGVHTGVDFEAVWQSVALACSFVASAATGMLAQ
jgi:hypothetical protein